VWRQYVYMWVIEGLLCGGSMCICGSVSGGYCVELVCVYVGH